MGQQGANGGPAAPPARDDGVLERDGGSRPPRPQAAAPARAPAATSKPPSAPGSVAGSQQQPAKVIRHQSYADLCHVYSDTTGDGAVFPKNPQECGPVVCPVLISRSHSLPYLEVLRHLAARGYTVLILVDNRNAEWVERAYGDVFSIERIPSKLTETLWADLDAKIHEVAEHGDKPATMARLLGSLGSDFAKALYSWTKKYVSEMETQQNKPSLFVVDMFYNFVADLCDELSIPFVATSSGLVPGMADTPWTRPLYTTDGYPTTLRMSLLARLHAAVVEPAVMIGAALPALRAGARVRRELGVTAPRAAQANPADRFRGRLSLINTFFGHETPRPLPATVRLIGPVRSHGAASAATRLEGEFEEFVEAHGGSEGKIVLLSFGQNCSVSTDRLRSLLGGLKRLLERRIIDGAVWSVSLTPEQSLVDAGLRDPNQTPSSILIKSWVPQKALLEHPAVRVFVSHGGTESSSEAFFAGKPVLSVPHFSDQPHNSRLIEEAGAGLFLSKRALSPEKVERALERIIAEPSFALSARRLRALAISSGRLATERAADELEYILHYGDGHLQPQGDQMSWVKRNNLDLYLAMAAIGVGAVAGGAALAGVVRRRG
jgi:UDP:flavonoid glycosyltransferase YjiC (YdhE family)